MRVLHVLAPAAHHGGLERVVRTLSGGQVRAGIDVHVAVVDDAPDPAAHHVFRAPGIETHLVHLPPRAYGAEREAIGALCRHVRPDVVHTHGSRPDLLDGAIARRYGAATISTVHGFTGGGFKNLLYEWMQCHALATYDAVVAVASSLRARLRGAGVPEYRIHVVPNACEPVTLAPRDEAREALGLARDAFVAGWVGRISPEKGADVLLAALGALPEDVHAAVLGDGAQRRRLEARSAAMGLGARMWWCGPVPDAPRYLSAFDVLALTSYTEACPMVILEAMAAGVPIVATTVGGIADLVGPDGALLVPPGRPDALAEALRAIRGDRVGAMRRAALARARFNQRFRVEPWVEQYTRLYTAARRLVAA